MNFTEFVQSSALTKTCANLFLWLALTAVLFVVVLQVAQGQQPSAVLLPIIGYGLGKAASILGVNIGQAIVQQAENATIDKLAPLLPMPDTQANTAATRANTAALQAHTP